MINAAAYAKDLGEWVINACEVLEVDGVIQPEVLRDIAKRVDCDLQTLVDDLTVKGAHDGVAATKQIALTVHWFARMRPISQAKDADGFSISQYCNEAMAVVLGLNLLADYVALGKIGRVVDLKRGRCHGACAEKECFGRFSDLFFWPNQNDTMNESKRLIIREDGTHPRNFEYVLKSILDGYMSVEALSVVYDLILYGACLNHQPHLVDPADLGELYAQTVAVN